MNTQFRELFGLRDEVASGLSLPLGRCNSRSVAAWRSGHGSIQALGQRLPAVFMFLAG